MRRRPKITVSILGELYEGVSYTLRSCEDGNSKDARVRTVTENEKDNSWSVSAFSPFSRRFIHFCLAKAVDSFSYAVSFFSMRCSSE